MLSLITVKPILYIANVSDDDVNGEGELAQRVRAHAESVGSQMVPVCARIESELAEPSDDEDKAEPTQGHGHGRALVLNGARSGRLQSSGLPVLLHRRREGGPAWTVPIGCKAPQAAGVIHTDFEKGFIRVECYSVDDLIEYKSEKAIKEAGIFPHRARNTPCATRMCATLPVQPLIHRFSSSPGRDFTRFRLWRRAGRSSLL
ncbi:MAG: DUF933 domain-containing protein [Phycisphaerales bacterium]